MNKPVSTVGGKIEFYRENKYAQNLLLKALSSGITDPQDLKKISGLRTVAQVFRTLDKMSIRKEYHAALNSSGLSFDTIVQNIKDIGENGESDTVKLKAWQVILKSLGLDKYDGDGESGKSWEEAILKLAEANKASGAVEEVKQLPSAQYEVIVPAMPATEASRRKEDKKFSDELYGK